MLGSVSKPITNKPSPLPTKARLLIDGLAGRGKTHLIATVGKGKKILVADLEDGTSTYSSDTYLNDPAGTEPENIDIIPFPTQGDGAITDVSEFVYRIEGALDYLIRTNNSDGYELFAIDSLTEFQKRFLSLHTAADPRQSYGALSDAMYGIIHKVRAAPVHVVFTSRPRSTRDEVQNRDIVRSDLAPATWSVISGLIDAIGYYDVKVQGAMVRRTLDFGLDIKYAAKDRYGLGELVNPTMREVLDAIVGTRKEAVPVATGSGGRPNMPRRIK